MKMELNFKLEVSCETNLTECSEGEARKMLDGQTDKIIDRLQEVFNDYYKVNNIYMKVQGARLI